MSALIELDTRETGGTTKARSDRRNLRIPGVIYGDHIPNRHVSIAANKISKLMQHRGSAKLLDVQLKGEKEPVKVIIQDVQRDPVSGQFKHIDFYQVRMDKKLHTEIPLEFTGTALAVKDLGGTLVKQIDSLPIECLPGDLINGLDVPIDSLKTFEDAIHVRDLSLPEGVITHIDENEIVAKVVAPRSEEEIAALEEEVKGDVGDVEVTGEKKEQGEAGEAEGAEGDAEASVGAGKEPGEAKEGEGANKEEAA